MAASGPAESSAYPPLASPLPILGRRVAPFVPRREGKGRTVNESVLDIFRRSGDANIGQTLVRLARRAEAEHRRAAAAMQGEQTSAGRRAANGLAAQVVVGRATRDSGHTEVDR